MKRLLAYHSIENIGIILMGLGIALIGTYARQPAWAALGLAGCLLHVWNHGLFKSLLFLAAGGVIMHAHTRQIDQMGGRAKVMPLDGGGVSGGGGGDLRLAAAERVYQRVAGVSGVVGAIDGGGGGRRAGMGCWGWWCRRWRWWGRWRWRVL